MINLDKYYHSQVVCKDHPDLRGLRHKSNKMCVNCNKEYLARWRANNKDKLKAHDQDRYRSNPEAERARKQAWAAANPDKVKQYSHDYRMANYDKYLAHCKHNNTIRHRLKKVQVISTYYTAELITIYQNCPPDKVVDHCVPLRGKTVSGLHVPWNLQYLTHEENQAKGNKLLPEFSS